MFYTDQINDELRFGDVLNWGILTAPYIEYNPSNHLEKNFKLDVNFPEFSVVITPCCSIDDANICLTPLTKVMYSFYDNPYFSEDLTRINRKMKPENTVSPERWGRFPPEERQKRLEVEEQYGLLEFFIYKNKEPLHPYSLKRKGKEDIKTDYYMIDFRNVYKLNSKNFKAPQGNLLSSKILELTPQTREELRRKISNYYLRIPDEDKCALTF